MINNTLSNYKTSSSVESKQSTLGESIEILKKKTLKKNIFKPVKCFTMQ